MVFEQIDFLLESINSIIVMIEILRLVPPLPAPVGAVVVSLQPDRRDSIGRDPELLECERREVCHPTALSLPPPSSCPHTCAGADTGVSHSAPVLISPSSNQLISLKLKLLDQIEGRDRGER